VGSPSGHAYLTESRFIKDHSTLNQAFVPQVRREYSGVASAVMVLNALRGPETPITQASFFIDPVREIRRPLWVSFAGMHLEHFRDAVRSHGVEAEAYFASDSGIDAFRSVIRENLTTDGDFLIVNYSRATLNQEGGGEHFAPVAAYHDPSDRILLLDPAIAHYPPIWVTVEAIWNAMRTPDESAPHGRGFVIVRE